MKCKRCKGKRLIRDDGQLYLDCPTCDGEGILRTNDKNSAVFAIECHVCGGDGLGKGSPITKSAWKDIDRHKMSLDPINGDIEWDGSYYSLLDKIAKYEEELKRIPAKDELCVAGTE